jgi:hypothetical protein
MGIDLDLREVFGGVVDKDVAAAVGRNYSVPWVAEKRHVEGEG